ncbi:MAG: flagellar biosynthesis protein FlhA [Desulfarculales bacterium]|jgi:flagellar biosynthesis protein FlhA|nr:flagellar biosynthesis protein FlhA [Desulfarculales bacterium]
MADSQGTLKTIRINAGNISEVGMAVGLVAVLVVMIMPLPTFLLDILLTFSITFALVVLLTSLYSLRPLDFSIFPSVLLVTTLLRLSLNVASSRLILLRGEEGPSAAGEVIHSFGMFVVGGNYVVGMIIFLILALINFIVITKGAERIAEVSARFTLDAMPGKQMAIDADLNSGLIDEDQARTRRAEVSREADFYGSMDGASKFVRGDAIAGMFIILVNILGGLLIGMGQKGMSFAEAGVTYTILTVGDGLVTQIPALVISTAAGILVSRAAGESSMGQEFFRQFTVQPLALGIAGGIIFILGLVPGLPHAPFLLLGGLVLTGAIYLRKEKVKQESEQKEMKQAKAQEAAQAGQAQMMSPEQVEALLPLDVMELEVGYGLIPLVDEEQNGDLLDRIRSIRQQLALEMGIVVPPLHVRDNLQLKAGAYSILIKGNEVAHGELMIDYLLAMDPGDAKKAIDGIPTREPAFNLPALWIPVSRREEAQFAGYSVVDISTVIATHLTEIIRSHSEELLGRQEVQKLIDNLSKTAPKPVEEMMRGLSLGAVQKVLQQLLKERISIRDLLTITETLADYSPMTKDVELLTEYCRQKLARGILKGILGSNNRDLYVLTVDPVVEDVITGGMQQTDQGVYLSLEPDRVQAILNGISALLDKFAPLAQPPVVLCSPVVRRHLRKTVERFVPTLAVLSHNELVGDINVHSVGTVQMQASPETGGRGL